MNRRTFITTGVLGGALLTGAGYVVVTRDAGTPVSGLQFISAPMQDVLAAMIPVVLDDSLPADSAARATAVNDVIEGFDRAISGMTPAVQNEVRELFGLLTTPVTRILVAGLWPAWVDASSSDVAGFLDRWRYSRFNLLRSGYQALTQLITATWYGNPLAWGKLSYIPPQFT
jgi:hypothetical protein